MPGCMGSFYKMHGLGNDFVVIDARAEAMLITADRARAIADRRIGIGCDQIILIEPSAVAAARMRIFNADGSEAGACGNASRAVALLLGGSHHIETEGGVIHLTATGTDSATVEMGVPTSDWAAIPLAYPMDTAHMPVSWDELVDPAAINVGNPHIIFFVPDCDTIDLGHIGPIIEHDPLFPQRINVNVATVTGASSLKLRVWERGAGLTQACGTGACATTAVALARRLVTGPVAVTLPGGELTIEQHADGRLLMSGAARQVFVGEADWTRFG
jgi:diaminopimelate epimerase